ncbi:MAG: AAA family ATPase [Candidatus Nanohaloarchaea archaeon]
MAIENPESLEDIVGHQDKKPTFQKYIEIGEIVTDLMFSGPPGVGKSAIAQILQKETTSGEINRRRIVCGETKNKGEDNTPRNVREKIGDSLDKLPLMNDPHNVVILEEFDSFKKDEQKKFKGLFEREGNARIILVTNHPEDIPEPVKSRFKQFRFSNLEDEEIRELAKRFEEEKSLDVEEKTVELIVNKADGDARTAIQELKELKARL